MDENLQNIEDLFREQLEDNEATPSEKVWNAIDNSFDKERLLFITRKFRIYRNIAGVLLLLLLITSSYFLIFETNNSSKQFYLKHDSPTSLVNLPKENSFSKITTHGILDSVEIELKHFKNNAKTVISIKHSNKALFLTSIKEKAESKVFNTIHNNEIAFTSPSSNRVNNHIKEDVDIKSTVALSSQSSDQDTINTDITGKISRNFPSPKQAVIDIRQAPQSVNPLPINSLAGLSSKTNSAHKFSIIPFMSFDKSWYHLTRDVPDNQADNYEQIKESEKHDLSLTAGVLVNLKIKKHWSLQSGLNYSNTNITVNPKEIYAQDDNQGKIRYRINTSTGYGFVLPSFSNNPVAGDSIYSFTSTHTLQYISIPLAVEYNITRGKFDFLLNTGFATYFLTKASLETTLEKGFNNEAEIVNKLQGVKKMYFGGVIAAGISYKLSSSKAIMYRPTLRFALNSINDRAPVKSYPNSFGQMIGLKITL